MTPLSVKNLTKRYPGFTLRDISFALEAGKITGFIGRNGAGKSTTLKSLLNFVHPDCGEIRFFDMEFAPNEQEIKTRIGYVPGAFEYYGKKKLRAITDTVRRFYMNWDENTYRTLLLRFNLDENKTPEALSAGMKVKYALTLALSHGAELLILDEPTSGLDPISREELLEIFLDLCDEGKTILFSTHITSDLEKCADHILYIREGELAADQPITAFTENWRLAEIQPDACTAEQLQMLHGMRRSKSGYTALVRYEDVEKLHLPVQKADLETVMVHLEKEETA